VTQLLANFHNSFILLLLHVLKINVISICITAFQVVELYNKFSLSLDPHLSERMTTMARVQIEINKQNEEKRKKKEMQKKKEAKKAQEQKNAG